MHPSLVEEWLVAVCRCSFPSAVLVHAVAWTYRFYGLRRTCAITLRLMYLVWSSSSVLTPSCKNQVSREGERERGRVRGIPFFFLRLDAQRQHGPSVQTEHGGCGQGTSICPCASHARSTAQRLKRTTATKQAEECRGFME